MWLSFLTPPRLLYFSGLLYSYSLTLLSLRFFPLIPFPFPPLFIYSLLCSAPLLCQLPLQLLPSLLSSFLLVPLSPLFFTHSSVQLLYFASSLHNYSLTLLSLLSLVPLPLSPSFTHSVLCSTPLFRQLTLQLLPYSTLLFLP